MTETESRKIDQTQLSAYLKRDASLIRHNTYAHNGDLHYSPIENWFTLVAGFSGKFVKECFKKYRIEDGQTILDPFVGTGTSTLTAIFDKKRSVGIDINPFNHVVAKTKTNFAVDLGLLNDYLLLLTENIEKLVIADNNDFLCEEVMTREIKSHLSLIWESRRNTKILQSTSQNFDGYAAMPHLHEWVSPAVLAKLLHLKSILKDCNIAINSEEVSDFWNCCIWIDIGTSKQHATGRPENLLSPQKRKTYNLFRCSCLPTFP